MSVRVRFAPSPTGYLHIGGARTALFNWLYAKHTGGKLILRIEDTDAARNTQEAMDAIIGGLHWLGIDWDEGPVTGDATGASRGERGPYFQSQRKTNYEQRVEALLSRDLAYERDGAIRFRMTRDTITIPDLVCGDVNRQLTDREEEDPDFVIVRSDGQPVFHLVNVVDDLDMGITHVIRGEDHLSNTSKHIALFKAFGVEPPKFAHIPLILNQNGSKMSKRDDGASIQYYQDNGYAPEAVLNYLCLLGWTHPDQKDVFRAEDIAELFDLPQIHRNNARFDGEKLKSLNYEHIREMDTDRFHELATQALTQAGVGTKDHPIEYVKAALDTVREKVKTFNEVPDFSTFYFCDVTEYDEKGTKKAFIPENREPIGKLKTALTNLSCFDPLAIESTVKSTASELGMKPGKLIHPTRLACTGTAVGPSLYHLMEVLGREKVIERLTAAQEKMG
jgi:glutamyl-tRNA synthetase